MPRWYTVTGRAGIRTSSKRLGIPTPGSSSSRDARRAFEGNVSPPGLVPVICHFAALRLLTTQASNTNSCHTTKIIVIFTIWPGYSQLACWYFRGA
eukprot:53141-Rhodomonas_salina.1